MNNLFRFITFALLLGRVSLSTAQFVIPEGQTFKASAGTDVAITSSLTNSSKGYWANARLHLVGSQLLWQDFLAHFLMLCVWGSLHDCKRFL